MFFVQMLYVFMCLFGTALLATTLSFPVQCAGKVGLRYVVIQVWARVPCATRACVLRV